MNRRRPVVPVLLAAAAGLSSGLIAPSAQATLAVAAFSVRPSTTQAGGTQTAPGPDLAVDARFATGDGDTPQNLTLSLAPGLLANPSAVPSCPSASFSAGSCPAASRIGGGYVTGTAPAFGLTLSLPTAAYLVQPQGSEAARIGLIVTFFDFPVATQSGPVTIRTAPDVGLDIPLTGLPREIEGIPVILDGLHLTIDGAVGGNTFTRNPTSCSSVSSTVKVNSYAATSTYTTASSSFTPTGCASLPYAPAISGTVTKDAGDDGIALSATVTQTYAEADTRSVDLSFPFSASPRLSALSQACTNADLTSCPSVGTASVTTPLLSAPLSARVVLVAHAGALPTLAILVPPPIGLQLNATPVLSGSSVHAVVDGIPDIPLTNLTLNLPGGGGSLFRAGLHLCSDAQSFGGSFESWNGVTAMPSAAATVGGCSAAPALSPFAAAPPAPRSRSLRRYVTRSGSGAPAGALGIAGADGRAPRVTVVVGVDRRHAIRVLTLRLPTGVGFRSGRLRVLLDGRPAATSVAAAGRRVTLRLARPGHVAIVSFAAPRLAQGRRIAIVATAYGPQRWAWTLHLTGVAR